jgi:hypothetical protein
MTDNGNEEKWNEEFEELFKDCRTHKGEMCLGYLEACKKRQLEIDELRYWSNIKDSAITKINEEKKMIVKTMSKRFIELHQLTEKLKEQNAKMRECLESIAFLDEPRADTYEYWESIEDKSKFAETLCNDTILAREMLKELEE